MIYVVGGSVIRLGLTDIPANTTHLYNIYIGLMLDQRRRRWADRRWADVV